MDHSGRLGQGTRCNIRNRPTDLLDNVLFSMGNLFFDDLKEALAKMIFVNWKGREQTYIVKTGLGLLVGTSNNITQ